MGCTRNWGQITVLANIRIISSQTQFALFQRRGETPMPKAYWIATYRAVKDPDKLAAYAKLGGPALTAAGGRFLARGEAAKVYELGVKQRTVLLEFESVAQAVAAHDSPAYQAALAALGDGAEREIRIVEGV
jgi:uncharacterized protein (DUF1330 family)